MVDMTLFKLQANGLNLSFISTFKRQIGHQFFINLLFLSFFSINFIIDCFCEALNSPTKKNYCIEAQMGCLGLNLPGF